MRFATHLHSAQNETAGALDSFFQWVNKEEAADRILFDYKVVGLEPSDPMWLAHESSISSIPHSAGSL